MRTERSWALLDSFLGVHMTVICKHSEGVKAGEAQAGEG